MFLSVIILVKNQKLLLHQEYNASSRKIFSWPCEKRFLNLSYFPLDMEDSWKVGVIKEIIDAKSDVLEVPGFDDDELETILLHLCTE